MPGGKSQLSNEFLGFLSHERDFYQSVLDLSAETGLGRMATDPDSHLDTELQENGDVQVKVVIAFDDNYDSEDGRLFLEDKFILDSKTGQFKNFDRSFSLHGALSEGHPFLEIKKKYEGVPKPDPEQAQSFVENVLRARPRDLNQQQGIQENLEAVPEFFRELNAALSKVNPDLQLTPQNSRNRYVLFQEEGIQTLILYLASSPAEEDSEETGPLLYRTKFSWDTTSGKFQGFEGEWQATHASAKDAQVGRTVKRLNQISGPMELSHRLLRDHLASTLHLSSTLVPWEDKALDALVKWKPTYFSPLMKRVQEVDANWTSKYQAPESGIQAREWSGGIEIVLGFAVEHFEDRDKGRIIVQHHLYVDDAGKITDQKLEGIPSESFWEDSTLLKKIQRLEAKKVIATEALQGFVDDLIPSLPPVKQKAVAEPILGDKGLADFQESMTGEKQTSLERVGDLFALDRIPETRSQEEKVEQTLSALHWIGTFYAEELAQREATSKGWLARGRDLNYQDKGEVLARVIEEAAQQATGTPGLSAVQALHRVSRGQEAVALAQELSRNYWVQKISRAQAQLLKEDRASSLIQLATEDLWKIQKGATAKLIADSLLGDEDVGSRAKEFVSLIEGQGSWGTTLEMVGPQLWEDLADPGMLAGMMIAPMGGVAAEGKVLARTLGRHKWLASSSGILSEAALFTATVDLAHSLNHDPAEIWSNFHNQVASTALMFLFLRFGHHYTGKWSARMAEGKLGRPAASTQTKYPSRVDGKVVTSPNPGVFDLTLTGKVLSGLMQHGSGVGAMWAAQALAAPWMPHLSEGPGRGGLLDAALAYLHAHVGFRLSNGISGGRLNAALGAQRLKLRDFDTSLDESLVKEREKLPEYFRELLTNMGEEGLKNFEDVLEDGTPLNIEIPLWKILNGHPLNEECFKVKMVYEEADNQFVPDQKWLEEYHQGLEDPRLRFLGRALTDFTLRAPAKPESKSEEGSLKDAVLILEEIAQALEENPENPERLEDKFITVNQILEIQAQRQKDQDNVDPRTIQLANDFRGLAELAGIDVEFSRDMQGRIGRLIKKISARVSRTDGEVMTDPHPEESGEYIGSLLGPEGSIDIRRDKQPATLTDLAGRDVAMAWAAESDGQVFVAVQVKEGEKIFVEGEEWSEPWIYPAEQPNFTIGGKHYEFVYPSRANHEYSGEEDIGTEPTQLKIPEKQELFNGQPVEAEAEPLGYKAWVIFEKESSGWAPAARELPKDIQDNQESWITLSAHRSGQVTTHGESSLRDHPRVILGAKPMGFSRGPQADHFKFIGVGEGSLADEQAMIYLGTDGAYYLVRLKAADPDHSVFLNGREIKPENSYRLYADSVVELQAKERDGQGGLRRYTVDILPNKYLPEAQKYEFNSPVGFGGDGRMMDLHLPETTRIESATQGAPLGSQGAEDVASGSESLEVFLAGKPSEDTEAALVRGLLHPEDTRIGSPNMRRPEVREMATPPPPEESVPSFHIALPESSEPKAEVPPREQTPEDRFGLKEDSMQGFDDAFELGSEEELSNEQESLEILPAQAQEIEVPAPKSEAILPPDPREDPLIQEMENLRARYSVRFGGQDPVGEYQAIFNPEREEYDTIMVNGSVKEVRSILSDLKESLAAPAETESQPLLSVEEYFSDVARLLKKVFHDAFGRDPFERAELIYSEDGSEVLQVKFFDPELNREVTLSKETYVPWMFQKAKMHFDRQKRAEQHSPQDPLEDIDESAVWLTDDTDLSSIIRFFEKEYGMKVGEVKVFEGSQKPVPHRDEEESKESSGIHKVIHEDILSLLSGNSRVMGHAFNRARSDVRKIPEVLGSKENPSIQGRLKDNAMRFWDDLSLLVEQNLDGEERMRASALINSLYGLLPHLSQPSSQNYTVTSDARVLTISTFLTGVTQSVKGSHIGNPSGVFVLAFRGEQNPKPVFDAVFKMLEKTEVPVEASIPLIYEHQGEQFVTIKYSDEFMGPVWVELQKMVQANDEVFIPYRVFLSDPVEINGGVDPKISHYRLDPQTGEHPLMTLKNLMTQARDVARKENRDGKATADAFQKALVDLFKKMGWVS